MKNFQTKRYICHRTIPALLAAVILLAACSGNVGTRPSDECAQGRDIANQELQDAKIKGFSGTIAWSKAASLLTAAEIQRQLERYPSCIDKVRRARLYIRESQR